MRPKRSAVALSLALFTLASLPCSATDRASGSSEVLSIEHLGKSYVVVKIDPRAADIRLFWKEPGGAPYRTIRALDSWLTKNGLQLVAAMNAGIFDKAQPPAPLGLHIESGQTLIPLNRRSGEGNFYLKPNGVFYIEGGTAKVVPSEELQLKEQKSLLATQSGPLLAHSGKIHPRFRKDSSSRRTRSGVGVDSQGLVYFAHSQDEVSFFELAALFRDKLKCPDALYLDGVISRIYAPPIAPMPRKETALAGILAVVQKREAARN